MYVCKCSATPFCLERKKEATTLFIGVQLFKVPISSRHTFTAPHCLIMSKGDSWLLWFAKNLGRRRLAGALPPPFPICCSLILSKKKTRNEHNWCADLTTHTHISICGLIKGARAEQSSKERAEQSSCSPINHRLKNRSSSGKTNWQSTNAIDVYVSNQ